MNTSLPTSLLSRPTGDNPIDAGTLGYFQARNRNRLYETVLGEFRNSGISQATLARRLGKTPDIVSRWLGAPGNWTLDTVSNLLFAISGTEPDYRISDPLGGARRNFGEPDWLHQSTADTTTTTILELSPV